MRTFLICEDAVHAEVVDQLVLAALRNRTGNMGSCWSGIWSDGTLFGIAWAHPVSDIFGLPESLALLIDDPDIVGDPSMVLVDEIVDGEGNSNWYLVLPEPPPPEEIL
jgi:hypothetical protein